MVTNRTAMWLWRIAKKRGKNSRGATPLPMVWPFESHSLANEWDGFNGCKRNRFYELSHPYESTWSSRVFSVEKNEAENEPKEVISIGRNPQMNEIQNFRSGRRRWQIKMNRNEYKMSTHTEFAFARTPHSRYVCQIVNGLMEKLSLLFARYVPNTELESIVAKHEQQFVCLFCFCFIVFDFVGTKRPNVVVPNRIRSSSSWELCGARTHSIYHRMAARKTK